LPALADLQRDVMRAILSGDAMSTDWLSAPGALPASAALQAHRDTALGGLTNSLRLTFPSIERLVGEVFFDQIVLAYVAIAPPRSADLCAYGRDFPSFLSNHAPAAALAYLADVARLDWAIARALGGPSEARRRDLSIDLDTVLSVPTALTVSRFDHPAAAIRAALDAGDDAALGNIDLEPRPRFVAVWRSVRLAVTRELAAPAGVFLTALLDGRGGDDALAAALAVAPPGAALAAIRSDIFEASFAQITISSRTTP